MSINTKVGYLTELLTITCRQCDLAVCRKK